MSTALLLFGLACATVIFVWSTLFERVRAIWPKFLGCPMCTGFWIGLGGSLLHDLHAAPLRHFLLAASTSVLAFALYLVLKRLEKPLLKDTQ